MYIRNSTLCSSALAEVCVVMDEVKSTFFKGRVIHLSSGKKFLFTGALEFLSILEEIYDTNGFPQATHSIRTFKDLKRKRINKDYESEASAVMENKISNSNQKGKATFVIKVLFRQNATWQGKIQWVEGNKTQNFRSDLEMLKLMDDALIITDNGEDDAAKWE